MHAVEIQAQQGHRRPVPPAAGGGWRGLAKEDKGAVVGALEADCGAELYKTDSKGTIPIGTGDPLDLVTQCCVLLLAKMYRCVPGALLGPPATG